jgi:hypothetical protein
VVELFSNFWFLVAVTIIVTSVVATLAQAWQKVRRAEQEAALKQEMLRRGLTVEEMERLLRVNSKRSDDDKTPPSTDEEAIEALAECLGECRASANVIEQVLAAVRAADPSVRQTACRAVQAVIRESEQEAGDEQILAVVRGLCRPAAPLVPVPAADPALPAKPEETFQLTRPA